jgi:hypothetical protein
MPKTISQAKENYVQSINIVPQRYQQGVEGADWKKGVGSAQANENYKAGIQKAISENSWKKGVDKVSNEEWKNAALTKGAQSISEGMRQGQDKYEQNFSPVLSAINSAVSSLPPRTTDPMSNIDSRLKPVVKAAINAAKK